MIYQYSASKISGPQVQVLSRSPSALPSQGGAASYRPPAERATVPTAASMAQCGSQGAIPSGGSVAAGSPPLQIRTARAPATAAAAQKQATGQFTPKEPSAPVSAQKGGQFTPKEPVVMRVLPTPLRAAAVPWQCAGGKERSSQAQTQREGEEANPTAVLTRRDSAFTPFGVRKTERSEPLQNRCPHRGVLRGRTAQGTPAEVVSRQSSTSGMPTALGSHPDLERPPPAPRPHRPGTQSYAPSTAPVLPAARPGHHVQAFSYQPPTSSPIPAASSARAESGNTAQPPCPPPFQEWPVPKQAPAKLATPREALERDLTEPEKVNYSDLEFVESLGAGEFGQVFRGNYRQEEVAIKQLYWDGTVTEQVMEDLAKEIESFRHLRHKRLVRFIGACLEMPHLCLVTEYMPGGSLHHLLHVRKLALPWLHSTNMCLQVADGVAYLHSQNPTIVHRDLKSLNIVLDLSLNIKICDFGLTEPMERTHITKKNNGGSPRYMAPELFDSKTKITEKIDIWAMGCIFVEVQGGPLPYETITTLADLTREMLVHRRAPLVPDSIPQEMRQVIISCLNFDYRLRPSSRGAFEQLKAAKKQMREARLL